MRRSSNAWITSFGGVLVACGGADPMPETPGSLVAPIVVAVPSSMSFADEITVLLATDQLADIYYSLDGSFPMGATGSRYEGPISLETTRLVTFIGVTRDGLWSEPRSELYRHEPPSMVTRQVPRRLQLEPNFYFFRGRPYSEEPVKQTFVVRSIGTGIVTLFDLELTANPTGGSFWRDGAFRVVGLERLDASGAVLGPLSAVTNVELAPDEAIRVTVEHQPREFMASAVIEISSDDEATAEPRRIELWGRVIK